jgi:hypothetical protein
VWVEPTERRRGDGEEGDGKGRRQHAQENCSQKQVLDFRRRYRWRSWNGLVPVDALIKLLQSPLVIDLLAVGATAALAAITENRSSRAQGGTGASGRTVKAAGKAAAAAIGRRLATEMEEIRRASQQSRERRTSRRGEAA